MYKKKNLKHELIINSKSKNYIVTIAIGSKLYLNWKTYCLKSWNLYCKKNKLGLIVIRQNLINKKNKYWKKPTWQKMLIGNYLSNEKIIIKNICYLDTDILINPEAPNIFDFHKTDKISIVSDNKKLPYDLTFVRKKLSFFRNKFYSKRYPLNSSLFMSVKEKYKYHGMRPQNDYFCAGVFVFNSKKFSHKMYDWFFNYKKNIKSITGDGDQTHLNYEVFKTKKINYLNYKFQALWPYEMALNYSYLYQFKKQKNYLLKYSIKECLYNNYFLHFAGSWYEGKMWKIKNIIDKKDQKTNKDLSIYLKKKIISKPVGRVIPK